MAETIDIHRVRHACSTCSLRELCLPYGIDDRELAQLETIVERRKPLSPGDALFHQGESLRSLFAVRAGSVKTSTYTAEGYEQVTGFHFPGELVGLDGLTGSGHVCSAVTLETTSVCEVPYPRLDELSGRIPGLRRQLLRLMSRELANDEELLLLLGQRTAEQRLAALLLSISRRFQRRGFSPSEFHLSMPRSDIANYLGLAVETVSRTFTRLQSAGVLTVEGRHVRILDLPGLARRAGAEPGAAEVHVKA